MLTTLSSTSTCSLTVVISFVLLTTNSLASHGLAQWSNEAPPSTHIGDMGLKMYKTKNSASRVSKKRPRVRTGNIEIKCQPEEENLITNSDISKRLDNIISSLKIPVDFVQPGNPIIDWLKKDHGFRSQPMRIDDQRVSLAQEEALFYYVYFLRHIHSDFRQNLGGSAMSDKWLNQAEQFIKEVLNYIVGWMKENFCRFKNSKKARWPQTYFAYMKRLRLVVDREFYWNTSSFLVFDPPNPFETGIMRSIKPYRLS